MSTPTPTDARPTTEHPEPLGASSVALGSAGARATKETAMIVFAAIQAAQQLNRRSHIDPREITKKIADLLRAIRDVFDKGRLNLKKYREKVEERRGRPASSATSEKKVKDPEPKKASSEKTAEPDKVEAKTTPDTADRDVEQQITKATGAASALAATWDIDNAAAVWGLGVLEDHKFARQVTELAENRMRQLDPELMAAYDAARGKGASRTDAMTEAMGAHPDAGKYFKEALARIDVETQKAQQNRLEGRLVNQVANLQHARINKGQEPLGFEELRKQFDEDTVSRGSHSYPQEMLDKVISADYEPSPEVKQAAFDLRQAEAELDSVMASGPEKSTATKTTPAKKSSATKRSTSTTKKAPAGPATTARAGTTSSKPKPKAPKADPTPAAKTSRVVKKTSRVTTGVR